MTETSRQYLSRNAVPVALTDEDLDQIDTNNLVTKVYYLPADTAVERVEAIVSTRLDPGIDPVAEAKRRGTIVAVLRSVRTRIDSAAPPTPAYGAWPNYATQHPWTPRKLNWEDGAWKLNFSGDPTDSPEMRGVQQATPKMAAIKNEKERKVIAKVYPVADLVVPLPGTEPAPVAGVPMLDKIPNQSKLFKAQKKSLSDLAQPLIDLIRKSIEPDSWRNEDDSNQIAFDEAHLSLIIRCPQQTQEKIADLLSALRRQQDLQVVVSCSTVTFTTEELNRFWERVGIDIDFRKDAANRPEGLLSPPEVNSFRKAVAAAEGANISTQLKATFFNGVGGNVTIKPGGASFDRKLMADHHSYLLLPTISPDRRSVELKFAMNAENNLQALSKARSFTIPDGNSVLVEVTDDLLAAEQDSGVPEVQRALRELKKKELGVRTFVLLTTSIVVQEEEEELLNFDESKKPRTDTNARVGTVSPHIIIQEEEEALLGIPMPETKP